MEPNLRFVRRRKPYIYTLILLALNMYFVKKLFFVEFTDNMQTNAGSYMAIARHILNHWPHLGWFPWWFNGEPFENSYSPILHFVDAGFASVAGCSAAHAFNFVTALFYVTGPVTLFVFAWHVSRSIDCSFVASLVYSLFSPVALFHSFRTDLGGFWNPWRLRVLVHYGEGPHVAELTILPLALLLLYCAFKRRRMIWVMAAALAMTLAILLNAFGMVDLAIGSVCLVLAYRGRRQMGEAIPILCLAAVTAYLWSSPFLTPTLLHTLSRNSQVVEGDFHAARLAPAQLLILVCFVLVWLASRRIADYYMRFSLLFAFVFVAITAMYALANRAALPQPNRYSLEMEMGVALAAPFLLRPICLRLPYKMKILGVALILVFAVSQTISYRRYAKSIIRSVNISQTIEYKIAKAFAAQLGVQRALVSAQAATWLNVFSDTAQMDGGHGPFNPNWDAQQAAAYTIYSGENAGSRDAEVSVMWLKAFGCQAVHVSGPRSRIDGKPFRNPQKFANVLPILWREEDDTIYAVPQRTTSLAHVLPADAVIVHKPIHGLDTEEAVRYVAALDNPAFPAAFLTWRDPDHGHIDAVVRSNQVVSVQSTYDKGWVATANGHAAEVSRDGIGLTVIHTDCDGPCAINLIFDGGLERKLCRAASVAVTVLSLIVVVIAFRRRRLVFKQRCARDRG
jgi:hypothetical protein